MPAERPARGGSDLTHKLGRVIPTAAQRKRAVPLRCFFTKTNGKVIPDEDDYASKAQPALTQMMNNNREGCCVATTLMKRVAMIHANRPNPVTLVATDAETSRLYHEIGGPGDNGLVMVDAYEYMMRTGAQIGGKRYKIDGYASIDVRDRATLDAAFHWFGGVDLGVNLLEAQYANFRTGTLWDCKPGRVVGGHAVPLTKRNAVQFRLATWAEQPDILRSCVENPRWADECYCVISRDMFDASGKDAHGLDWPALSAAMDAIRNGQTPVVPDDPTPPPAPSDHLWEARRDWSIDLLMYHITASIGLTVDRAKSLSAPANWGAAIAAAVQLLGAVIRKDWPGAFAAALELLRALGVELSADNARQLMEAAGRATWVLTGGQTAGNVDSCPGGDSPGRTS